MQKSTIYAHISTPTRGLRQCYDYRYIRTSPLTPRSLNPVDSRHQTDEEDVQTCQYNEFVYILLTCDCDRGLNMFFLLSARVFDRTNSTPIYHYVPLHQTLLAGKTLGLVRSIQKIQKHSPSSVGLVKVYSQATTAHIQCVYFFF